MPLNLAFTKDNTNRASYEPKLLGLQGIGYAGGEDQEKAGVADESPQ